MIRNTRVERFRNEGLWFWVVYRDLVDDATGATTKAAQVVPEDAVTIRAAEYELDPTDPHLSLDFILHECLIENPPPVAHLFTASTVAEARAAHQGDVDGVRARFGHGPMPRVRAARDVHIAGIAAQTPVDLAAYNMVRQQVSRTRDIIRITEPRPLAERLAAQQRRAGNR